jgi:hypothetical protein
VYQDKARSPLGGSMAPPDEAVRKAMWRLFEQIGKFWKNIGDPSEYESRLYSFMSNRIAIDPLYVDYYATAQQVIEQLIADLGSEGAAFQHLFTDAQANASPPTTPIGITRQKVSNEFVALQMALGGFLSFGALNYPGYFGGANVPGAPVPYRTMDKEHGR